jgi:hypothetical protein
MTAYRGWLGLLVACALAGCGDDAGTPLHPADAGTDAPATADATPGADAGLVLDHPLVDHAEVLAGLADPAWYEANIPFLDLPDADLQDVYYYRFSTYRRNLHYTTPATGYIVSEFVHAPGYASAFGGVNAAAGHHIYEGRWLKTQRYLDDYQRYWLTGPGQPGAHQYSFWAADAAYARYLVNGDKAFVTGILADLVHQYDGWSDHLDAGRGLYWQVPVWDAMEFTIGSYQTSDPYHGGDGFRPTLNAYQFGDARAIAAIARLAGDETTAATFDARAAALKTHMDAQLWDPARQFYFHMMTRNAAQAYAHPEGTLLDGREQVGFVPWYFNMPDEDRSIAWAQLVDPQGFAAPYGPTTAEQRHPLYMHEAALGCCRWDGPSWPYATSQTLTALANLLDNYQQTYVAKADYLALLSSYARAQHKQGAPYVAEALDPVSGAWTYDAFNHSEHYNHSSYVDLIITGLIGLRPRADDILELAPLVPDGWSYFALEDVLYHGHRLTVVFDRDGSRYGLGAGLIVFQDGVELARRADVGRMRVPMAAVAAPVAPPRLDNVAANPLQTGFPRASASCTNSGQPGDDPKQAVDGVILYDDIPNSRWTSYGCAPGAGGADDWLEVDFGSPELLSGLTLHLYADGGGVAAPASYRVETWDGAGWVAVANPVATPAVPAARQANVVSFGSVTSSKLRVVFTRTAGVAVGVTELEVWQ